jgi:hypothetical protein
MKTQQVIILKNLMPAKMVAVALALLLTVVIVACQRQSDQANAKHDTGTAGVPATAATQPQPESVPPIERPPDVIGYPKPQDGVAFTGVFVLNECGTIGSPTDCLAKELPQHSYTGPASVYQVTLKIERGAYETWACVLETDLRDNINDFIKWHIGADFNEAWSCGADENNDGPAVIDLVAGQKYRFARKGNTILSAHLRVLTKCRMERGHPR